MAWLPVLAFDPFVGRWVVLGGRERGLHPPAIAPVLLPTFLHGPLGFPTDLLPA